MILNLFYLRNGGANYREPVVWMQLLGLLNLTSATIGLVCWGTHNARVAQRATGTVPADPRTNGCRLAMYGFVLSTLPSLEPKVKACYSLIGRGKRSASGR